MFDICGLEVDRDTGKIRIDRYITTHDSGVLLNPLLANGQIYGGFGWGVGAALSEQFVYGEDGSFLSGTFSDYLCPTACEVPEPQILHMETPSPLTPLGAKGIGEGSVMSTPVCIANAFADATGIKDVKLPLNPWKVAALIQGEEPPRPKGQAAPARARTSGKGLQGEGSAFVPATPEQVWATLINPEKLAQVIPGCSKLEAVGPNSYRAELSLGVGAVRGRFEARITLSNLKPPKSGVISGGLQGPLGSSEGVGNITLEAVSGGTQLNYDYGFDISGKVAAVGGRMLDGTARVIMKQFFERLASLTEGRAVAAAAPPPASWWKRLLKALGIAR
ncbi:MAG: molybdopterin-dependent oxidoreductase [Betaproteobacteria bacterium]|nr:molybdopterin-dependent oxidoreductase [Betaproteobacteria bacterium]